MRQPLTQNQTVQVVVITGDNKLTAEAICRQIGIFYESEDLEGKSMTGRSFVELPIAERKRILEARFNRKIIES